MDPGYAAHYRDLHARHWWWRAREAVVARELRRWKPDGGWRRALDVGCGDGLHFPLLLKHADAVEGIEPDAALLGVDPATGTVQREGGTIHVRPFDEGFAPGRTYDLIVFLDVLEHLDDPETALAQAFDLMEPGGLLLITVPAYMHLWTTHDDLNRHVTRYTIPKLRGLLEGAGFRTLHTRHFFRWVHGAKLVQRAVESAISRQPAPPRVPPGPINALARWFSTMEDHALRSVPLGVGSSILAVFSLPGLDHHAEGARESGSR
ncbi:MAG: class I SAM-dependent methyltransferase [Longimicrobiales bacterium]